MSLDGTFNHTTQGNSERPSAKERRTRPAPFSLRLNENERARLAEEAKGAPLGAYIKAKALGGPPLRVRRSGLPVEDRQALAQALALLGRSRISSNLNQLAYAVNIGSLPVTPETEAELAAALRDVREVRRLLVAALGLEGETGA